MFESKKEEKKKTIRYDVALTDNEILQYSQIVDRFKKGEIDFQTLRDLFLNNGVTIEPVFIDYTKLPIASQIEEVKKRILERNYLYNDINYFILNSKEFKNVVFRIDYKAIELLANYGVPEYQKAMISTLVTQLRHSYTNERNDELEAKRSKWQRRIAELELALSKDDRVNKTL